ncbi:hypothetical protein JL107_17100 [Nakamurella flavida]|uniref:Uncharacterized protein n=1 Tax=Nakamurella flavida TaxID=363630 RepID=A0A939C1Y2_9ACTN|nr:hypothetical protein [Nakamurella flavida]MBM9478168.1 hypothetical protein [Nakamurella flavida]MDP9778610.1 hypothetical protein [Nakamurella flavida]
MTTTQMWDADRLTAMGLTAELITRVLLRADGETEECTDLDPPILQGLMRWGRTTRHLREELVRSGWTWDNPRNLARTIHPSGDLAIVVTAGDEYTALPDGEPGTRHPKGWATELAVQANGQLVLDLGPLERHRGIATGAAVLQTWLLLFHLEPGWIRAEISRPAGIAGGRITRWSERILLEPIPRQAPGGVVADADPAPASAVPRVRRAPTVLVDRVLDLTLFDEEDEPEPSLFREA